MKIFSGSKSLTNKHFSKTVTGIGIFDGVHVGHQELLKRVSEKGQALNSETLIYTFHPHPAKILNPELAPPLIEPLEQRLARFKNFGIHNVVVEEFTPEFAKMRALTYIQEILQAKLHSTHIVIGHNFSFGRGQEGNSELLKQIYAPEQIEDLELLKLSGITVSSSKIREFVREGHIEGANLLLGRPFSLAGTIEAGQKRGRTLGFPTANLTTPYELWPASGVYAARALGDFGVYPAVVNIGFTPTFGGSAILKIEAHFLDYPATGDLYGQKLTLEFFSYLRKEQCFSNVQALTTQIQHDIRTARKLLALSP